MKHIVNRFIVDFEKEENWLNEMAAKGFHFIYFSFPCRYVFEEGKPGDYIYRLEFLDNLPGHPESKAYIKFMEETGVECVSSYFRWVWFRKKASDGPFDLYTDYSSKIKHYKRIAWFTGIVGLLNHFVGVWNFSYGLFVTGPRYHVYYNSYLSPISIAVAIICFSAFFSYRKRLKKMKKESVVRE